VGVAAFVLSTGEPAAAQGTVIETLQTHLYAGRTAEAAAALEQRLAAQPDDDQARYALGAVQFVQAVEGVAQFSYRHGMRSSVQIFMLPFFRLPVEENPSPQPLTYELTRHMLQTFVDDLARAEATLAGVDDPAVKLPLNIGLVHLDSNGDGAATPDEALWYFYQRIAEMGPVNEQEARKFAVHFDGSDVPWLRGYCHLLMALGEFFLAHDWQMAFDHTFHILFPRAGLPYSVLVEHASAFDEFGEIADLLAFLHLLRLEPREPQRLAASLAHLESMVTLSRENWRRVQAETDDDREWIPSPRQTGVMPAMPVTPELVQAWQQFLDELEALLQGRKLMTHWRLPGGINLRRVFLEPRTFDLVLWVQGSAALPYLEDGPLSREEDWRRIIDLFRGDFFSYAIWFN
jgi:hypothetical protein